MFDSHGRVEMSPPGCNFERPTRVDEDAPVIVDHYPQGVGRGRSHLQNGPQPSGIRVSDAGAWARAIYDRYVDVDAHPTVLTVSPEHPWDVHQLPRPGATWHRRGSHHNGELETPIVYIRLT